MYGTFGTFSATHDFVLTLPILTGYKMILSGPIFMIIDRKAGEIMHLVESVCVFVCLCVCLSEMSFFYWRGVVDIAKYSKRFNETQVSNTLK